MFDANFGGTNIYGPMDSAFNLKMPGGFKKRIFMLTDGQVSNKPAILQLIVDKCSKADDTKVFSFGMGTNCDRDLITQSAKDGKGKSYFVFNDDTVEMKEQVIDAL